MSILPSMANEKKVSRQREYQRRHRKLGLCMLCAEPGVRRADGKLGMHCERHREYLRQKSAERYAIYKAAVAAIRAAVKG